VRLVRGDFSNETDFGDPIEVALAYRDAGADRVHVVDLDAARSGEAVNRPIIGRIAATGLVVQAGGGVRSEAAAEALFDEGVDRVIVGTAVVEQPDLLARLARHWPGRVVAGLDHRSVAAGTGVVVRELALRGWVEASGRDMLEVLGEIEGLPLAGVVVTNISRDGTGSGPDLDGLRAVLATTDLPVVAAGGVATAADLRRLAALVSGERRLDGVIAGRALLSGSLGLRAALRALAEAP
jgi:phosphoribosylformimino-5-aminoimidazole carboxamide ribotide isomerase